MLAPTIAPQTNSPFDPSKECRYLKARPAPFYIPSLAHSQCTASQGGGVDGLPLSGPRVSPASVLLPPYR